MGRRRKEEASDDIDPVSYIRGSFIREQRIAAGFLRIRDLANASKGKFSKKALDKLESGLNRAPSLAMLKDVAELLGIPVEELGLKASLDRYIEKYVLAQLKERVESIEYRQQKLEKRLERVEKCLGIDNSINTPFLITEGKSRRES